MKAAKFFCENCGALVPANARMCPHCGRFFSSVRCPQCGKTGSSKTFENGCPRCGYAVGDSSSKNIKTNIPKEITASRKARKRLLSEINKKSPVASLSGYESSAPKWLYIACPAALLVCIFIMLKYLSV